MIRQSVLEVMVWNCMIQTPKLTARQHFFSICVVQLWNKLVYKYWMVLRATLKNNAPKLFNVARGPSRSRLAVNIDANAWCHVVYTMFPGNMDHVMPCSPGTWCCTDKTRQHCSFLHITWCASDESRLRNSDRDITIGPVTRTAGILALSVTGANC